MVVNLHLKLYFCLILAVGHNNCSFQGLIIAMFSNGFQTVAVNHEYDTCFGNGLVMYSADYLYYAGLVKISEKCTWPFARYTASRCLCFPAFPNIIICLTHVAFLQFMPLGQYGLYFWLSVSGPLTLHSHKRQVNFSGPFLRVPSHLDYTRNWPEPS